MGCGLWSCTEQDTTEATQQQQHLLYRCFVFLSSNGERGGFSGAHCLKFYSDMPLYRSVLIFHIYCCCQSLSCVQLFATLWTAACQTSLYSTISWSLLKFMSIELVMLSNLLILCCPLLLWPSTFPSIRVFSNESALQIKWPKYWSFSFNISPSIEHPGLSLQDGLVGSPCSPKDSQDLLQHHSSKASILWRSAFFIVQLSHLYLTTGKTIALTRWTFVGKVMSLPFKIGRAHV